MPLQFVPNRGQWDAAVRFAAVGNTAGGLHDDGFTLRYERWSAPAASVHNRIRGLSPFPGAWFEADFGRGVERVKVLRATLAQGSGAPGSVSADKLVVACGEGAIALLNVQRAGGKAVSAAEFARGIANMPASFS